MAGRKLSAEKQGELKKVLASKIRENGDASRLSIYKDIGARFGVSVNAVAYHAARLRRRRGKGKRGPGRPRGRGAKRGRPRGSGGGGSSVAKVLLRQARELRRKAKRTARALNRQAKAYEKAARILRR